MDIIAELVRSRITENLLPVNERDEIMEPLAEPARFNRVQIVTGMRRSGKTFYLFQQMRKLIEQGVPRRHVFYFDFSDDRLPLSGRVMDEVFDEYWRQVPSARMEGAYLFLDEVQDACFRGDTQARARLPRSCHDKNGRGRGHGGHIARERGRQTCEGGRARNPRLEVVS